MRTRLNAPVLALSLVFATSSPAAQSWTFEPVVPFGAYFDLAVEPDGTPHIVYTNCVAREICDPASGVRQLIHGERRSGVWMFDSIAVDPAGFTSTTDAFCSRNFSHELCEIPDSRTRFQHFLVDRF